MPVREEAGKGVIRAEDDGLTAPSENVQCTGSTAPQLRTGRGPETRGPAHLAPFGHVWKPNLGSEQVATVPPFPPGLLAPQ